MTLGIKDLIESGEVCAKCWIQLDGNASGKRRLCGPCSELDNLPDILDMEVLPELTDEYDVPLEDDVIGDEL